MEMVILSSRPQTERQDASGTSEAVWILDWVPSAALWAQPLPTLPRAVGAGVEGYSPGP